MYYNFTSGMLEAGRVKHHVANNIENPRNTILIVGYCAPTTLGARLQQPGLREKYLFLDKYIRLRLGLLK